MHDPLGATRVISSPTFIRYATYYCAIALGSESDPVAEAGIP